MSKRKTVVHNFQRGTTGRDDDSKSVIIKTRTSKKTVAYHVRCDADRSTKACKTAIALVKAAQNRLASEPDDTGATRRIIKGKRHKGE